MSIHFHEVKQNNLSYALLLYASVLWRTATPKDRGNPTHTFALHCVFYLAWLTSLLTSQDSDLCSLICYDTLWTVRLKASPLKDRLPPTETSAASRLTATQVASCMTGIRLTALGSHLRNYYMKRSLPWESHSHSDGQEFPSPPPHWN
jgi:hypothetical protein